MRVLQLEASGDAGLRSCTHGPAQRVAVAVMGRAKGSSCCPLLALKGVNFLLAGFLCVGGLTHSPAELRTCSTLQQDTWGLKRPQQGDTDCIISGGQGVPSRLPFSESWKHPVFWSVPLTPAPAGCKPSEQLRHPQARLLAVPGEARRELLSSKQGRPNKHHPLYLHRDTLFWAWDVSPNILLYWSQKKGLPQTVGPAWGCPQGGSLHLPSPSHGGGGSSVSSAGGILL